MLKIFQSKELVARLSHLLHLNRTNAGHAVGSNDNAIPFLRGV
jgi:hypothetical protein